jgi:hypothetical protein
MQEESSVRRRHTKARRRRNVNGVAHSCPSLFLFPLFFYSFLLFGPTHIGFLQFLYSSSFISFWSSTKLLLPFYFSFLLEFARASWVEMCSSQQIRMYLFSRFFAILHKNHYFLSMICKTLKHQN